MWQIVSKLSDVLRKLHETTESVPPIDTKSRFGNPAFRDWYDLVKKNAKEWLSPLTPLPEALVELEQYFLGSFGSRQRIDYGTGHELSFLALLRCLRKLGAIQPTDYEPLVLKIFYGYIKVMRELQTTYWLEPAGSHGVWGLDDFHFLPFLFGAAQLKGHKFFRPKSIHNEEILDEFSKDYMYFDCIRF
ncbi:Serine/threonine-protein phosphatase 2A activator 2, partial [Spiromyces aspiralis]